MRRSAAGTAVRVFSTWLVIGSVLNACGSSSEPPPAVATVQVAPANDTLLVGEASQLTVTLRDADNNVLTGRTVTWSSSHASIASISAAGLVTGVSDGEALITATSEGQSGSMNVRVFDQCSTALASSIAVGQTINGSLSATDCQLPDDTFVDAYGIQVSTATNVQIDMTASFDTWLFLVELLPDGTLEDRALNDDIDPDDPDDPNDTVDTNSRIIFTLQPGAEYFIVANSFEMNTFGDYQLTVTEVAPFVTGASVAGKQGKAPIAALLKSLRGKPVKE